MAQQRGISSSSRVCMEFLCLQHVKFDFQTEQEYQLRAGLIGFSSDRPTVVILRFAQPHLAAWNYISSQMNATYNSTKGSPLRPFHALHVTDR